MGVVQIDVVVGIRNGGSQPLNFTAIMGSLNAKDKFSFFIQNFTFTVGSPGSISPLITKSVGALGAC